MGMMNVCLSHDTAFRWLMRNRSPRMCGLTSMVRVLPLSSPSSIASQHLLSALSLDDDKLEVLVCRSNGRRGSGGVVSHLSGLSYPAGSFVRVPVPGVDGVYSASPELVFRQIAAKRSLLEAVYVGYALCSSYRVDGSVEGGIAIRAGDDEPLTSVERIRAYLERTEGSYGCAKARRALSYVREGSMSPTESGLAMGLNLPSCLGGFDAGDVLLQGTLTRIGEMGAGVSRRVNGCSVALTMEESGCGKGPVAMVVLGACDGDDGRRNRRDAEARQDGGGGATISVTPSQVYEFGAYVQLCEKIRQQLAVRDSLSGELADCEVARRKAIRARQADLWRTLVCFSAFRQAETGGCVSVFDPPCFRRGR